MVQATPAASLSTVLCKGFTTCKSVGLTDHVYGAYYTRSWWGQYAGHNCTNYAAYRLARAGVRNPGITGNAGNWGPAFRAKGYAVNKIPAKGAVGWYAYGSRWAPTWGHVSIVEGVTATTVTLSEDSISGNGFRYRRITRTDAVAMPSGFIHVADAKVAIT